MDPYVTTIVRQSAVIFVGCAVLGLAVAVIYGLAQYGKLQYAMTLNIAPPDPP